MEHRAQISLKLLFVSALVLIFTGCQSSVRFSHKTQTTKIAEKSTEVVSHNVPIGSLRSNIVEISASWLGTPYCWGGDTRRCADCSGFVSSVFVEAGINIPRTSNQQFKTSISVSKGTAEPGDLVFFQKNNTVNHVGIYLGNGFMIHSSSSKGVVRQSIYDDYYKQRFAGFGRIIFDNL